MKGLFALLLFLVVLAGVVFFFGWIQIQVPPDGYGVIFTRTHGWEAEVIRPGTFVWRWQRLIPTNLTLYVFEPGLHRTPVRLQGSLPSGTAISTILQDSGSFDYDLRLTVQSRIIAAHLPSLARDRELRPEDIGGFYDEIDAMIGEIATQAVLSVVERQPERITPGTAYDNIVETVKTGLARRLDYLEVVAVAVERIDLPDMDLYLTARQSARDVLEARSRSLQQAAERLAQNEAETDRGLSLLERYGELLDRYPVLIDYVRVGQEIDGDPLNLESIIPRSSR